MLRILIPKNNINEREYIINIIFNEFLELKYELETYPGNEYEITLANNNKIIIEDHFFNKYPEELSYLDLTNIHRKVYYVKNEFITEDDIPVIFGSNKLETDNNSIRCGIDIFASSFFMLTRWEEYLDKTRDKHGRFPGKESFAFKNNILHRPVVNEYVEMLWNMLISLNPGLIR